MTSDLSFDISLVLALKRDEIIKLLEDRLGMACYDEEDTDYLRNVLVDSANDPCLDGVLCPHRNHQEYRAAYFHYQQEGEEVPLWYTFLGEFAHEDEVKERTPGYSLIEVDGLESNSKFYFECPPD